MMYRYLKHGCWPSVPYQVDTGQRRRDTVPLWQQIRDNTPLTILMELPVFLSCGDALFDIFAKPESQPGLIELEGFAGGSPMNVAIGLARMGNDVGYLAKNSTDMFGRRIRDFLAHNNVKTDWLVPSELNSTLAMVELNNSGAADYSFYTSNTADCSLMAGDLPAEFPDFLHTLHVGSYSTGKAPTADTLISLIEREHTQRFISYDPNLRLSIEPDITIWQRNFRKLASHANLVKASDEDIAGLFGDDTSIEAFAEQVLDLGPSLVLVTRGGQGADAFHKSGEKSSTSGFEITVKDTVGAGDTFQAASLHWLHQQGYMNNDGQAIDLQALLRFATAAAAVTCTRQGADLPNLDEVESFLKNH